MENFFKSLKRKLSVDNLFTRGQNDEPLNKDEDVRRTLEKTEPNDIIHVDEITEKLKEITELSKNTLEEPKSNQSTKVPDKPKPPTVLQKSGEEDEQKPDNVMTFLD